MSFMTLIRFITALALAAAALAPLPARCGPGHDHDEAASVPAGPALPRFVATSELFELVGVLNGRRLTLYLDRSADNAPVTGARIELEIGGTPFKTEARDDVYEVTLPAPATPGLIPVTAVVAAGADVDLLAGELNIPDEAADGAQAPHAHGWQEVAVWIATGLVALLVIVVFGRRFAAGARTRNGVNA